MAHIEPPAEAAVPEVVGTLQPTPEDPAFELSNLVRGTLAELETDPGAASRLGQSSAATAGAVGEAMGAGEGLESAPPAMSAPAAISAPLMGSRRRAREASAPKNGAREK